MIVVTQIVYEDEDGELLTAEYQTGLSYDSTNLEVSDVLEYIADEKLGLFLEESGLDKDRVVNVHATQVGPKVLRGFLQHLTKAT